MPMWPSPSRCMPLCGAPLTDSSTNVCTLEPNALSGVVWSVTRICFQYRHIWPGEFPSST